MHYSLCNVRLTLHERSPMREESGTPVAEKNLVVVVHSRTERQLSSHRHFINKISMLVIFSGEGSFVTSMIRQIGASRICVGFNLPGPGPPILM